MHNTITDEELLYLIEENEEKALEELIERYSQIINIRIAKYKDKAYEVGLDISDLYQEGLVGLITAVKSYNNKKDATFKTYAELLVERQLRDLIKTNSRIKHRSLNNAVSLDGFNKEETKSLYDIIDIDTLTPELKLINMEEQQEIRKHLTPFELKVFELKLEGKTNKQIALILDKNKRSIENTIQRIKSKSKEIIWKFNE